MDVIKPVSSSFSSSAVHIEMFAFTEQRYASVVYAIIVCLTVCHKSVFY